MTEKESKQLIAQGEGYFTEFKRKLNSDFKRELVAFANASGGRILMGVEDDGSICGAGSDNELRSRIQAEAQNCDPPVRISMEQVGSVLVVSVPEGEEKPYRSTEGFYLRVGPNAQKMTTRQIREFMENEGLVRFDEVVRKDVDFRTAVSAELVNRFMSMADIRNVFTGPEHVLENLGALKR